jgi:hypothetical protein
LLKDVVALHRSWDEISGLFLEFKLVPGTVCLRLQPNAGTGQESTIILFTDKKHYPESVPSIGQTRKANKPQSFDGQMRWIKSLITKCQKEHPACVSRSSSHVLPTRVVDVGSDEKPPFLYTTKGELAPYVALSHCWGPEGMRKRQLMTKRSSLEEHSRLIPPKNMPKTFRDAVAVTRALGIRYIWIDSLCILQDDHLDWEIESARMATVYRNAAVTLAAEWATSSDDGCFPPDGSPRGGDRVKSLSFRDPLTNSTHDILARCVAGAEPAPALDGVWCFADEATGALSRRAWALQERVLSPRAVFFTRAGELVWECATLSRCGCAGVTRWRTTAVGGAGGAGAGGGTGGGSSGGDRRRGFRARLALRAGVGAAGKLNWHHIVEDFTARDITHAGDRLPALSGLAAAFARPGASYLAGVWSDMVLTSMQWRSTPAGKSARHATYYAPSFSWASVTGRVEFPEALGSFRTVFHVPTCKAVETTPAGSNKFGPASAGWITWVGMVADVAVRKGASDKEPAFSVVPRDDAHIKDVSGVVFPDVLPATEITDQSTGLRLLFMGVFMGVRIGIDQHLPIAVLLKPSGSRQKGYYMRVGLVECTSWISGWDMVAQDYERVTII